MAALAVGFAPMAWADGPEPPAPDICAPIGAQFGRASVLPERKELWEFVFGLGVRRGDTRFGPAFEVSGWSFRENILLEIENSPPFLLGFGPSPFFLAGPDQPRQVGVAGFLKFYEDSRSRLVLYELADSRRERPHPIRQVNVGLARSAFYTNAAAFEANITRPLVCAAFEAVRQGRVDRPVVVLAVENVTFCQDFSGPEPQICGLNIEGRVTGIFYRPEIPPPPPPSTDGRG